MFQRTLFKNIQSKANEVLFTYNISDCPAMYMNKIIKDQGINYSETDRFSSNDGFYMVKGDKKAIIVKKTVEPLERKNYTIAHELGHHFIGHCSGNGTIECKVIEHETLENSSNREHDRIEQEANVFASYFLMPKVLVEPVVKQALVSSDRAHIGYFFLDSQQCNIRDWQICCSLMQRSFKTSKTAIKWRLFYLGYVKLPV